MAPPRISFVSLGCPEGAGRPSASSRGCAPKGMNWPRPMRAPDAVIVNTCGFLDSAKARSLAAIRAGLRKTAR
ncbi:MAG: hypothetical protein H6871_01400 [Methylobacteriaceae bacterium]|nr:hypothetical protein [Methylobacteriaceae bacterium]